jgi:hypothetical protein
LINKYDEVFDDVIGTVLDACKAQQPIRVLGDDSERFVRKLTPVESAQYLELVGEGIPSFYLENVVLPHLQGKERGTMK